MNGLEFLTLFQMILNTPSDSDQIRKEREASFECVKQKKCVSFWRDDLQDFIVYNKEDLENCKFKQYAHEPICNHYQEVKDKIELKNPSIETKSK